MCPIVKKNVAPQLIQFLPALAYYSISINLAAASSPLKDPRVREALADSIGDRVALNQVVFDGLFIPEHNQFEAPGSKYWDPDHPGAAA